MNKLCLLSVIFLSFLVPCTSSAITIDYTLTSLGGSSYRYDYTVTNDGSLGQGVNVKLFDIAFTTDKYSELSLTNLTPNSLSSEWTTSFLASAPGEPALFDAFALGDGVSSSTSGFSVQFDWIGAGNGPGSQKFFIYDPDTYDQLSPGTTNPIETGTPVPEPGTLALLGVGFAMAILRRKFCRNS